MTVYVRLRVAAEAYAMAVEHVLEVTSLGHVDAVPRARPEMLGVQNLRGRILPVIDLALLLGISRTVPPSHLLVAEAGGRQAGFAIDEVRGVDELAGPAEEAESDLLLGSTLGGDDLIGILNVPRVFDRLEETPQ